MRKKLTLQQQRMIEIIHSRDRDNPVLGDDLARMLHTDIRDVRGMVRELIMYFHIPIGSCTRDPAGYYWIQSAQEMDENYRRLWARGWAILRRAYKMKVISRRMVEGQLKLEGIIKNSGLQD